MGSPTIGTHSSNAAASGEEENNKAGFSQHDLLSIKQASFMAQH